MEVFLRIFFIVLEFTLFMEVRALVEEGIVVGDIVQPGDLTYQVSVLQNGSLTCGGGILNDFSIIACVHCVLNDANTELVKKIITIIAGRTLLSRLIPIEMFIRVIKIYFLKSYKLGRAQQGFETEADVAVLRLERGLAATYNRKFTTLQSSENFFSNSSMKLIVAGFGCSVIKVFQSNGNMRISSYCDKRLRYAEAKLISHNDCNEMYGDTVPTNNMCVQMVQRNPDNPEGACLGDSGGPLVVDGNTVIGILVAGPINCNEAEKPGVYARISVYHSFIESAKRDVVTNEMRVATLLIESPNVVRYVEQAA